ncbi:MAG: diguanylate cyclase [Pseudomonadota bacterium]
MSNIGATVYPFRVVGFYLAGLAVYDARGFEVPDPSWLLWTVLMLFVAYPHVAFARYASHQTRETEVVHLQVDMLFVGVVTALLAFNPVLAGPFLIANSAANYSVGGLRLLLRGLVAALAGAALAGLLFGFDLELDARAPAYIPALVYLVMATHYLGFLSHARGNALRRQKREAELLAYSDGLTGVSNRRRFDAALEQSWDWELRQRGALSLILLDIDYFKLFNDHYGHPAGDECLRAVARCIEHAARDTGATVARTGGEEFAVLVSAMAPGEARELADQIRNSVRLLGITHEASLVASVVTVSVGVASVVPVETLSSRALMLAADQALYRAKQSGRDQISARSVTGASESTP